jgi:hypothetical protein
MNSLEENSLGLLTLIVAPAILTRLELIPDAASRTGNRHPRLGRGAFKWPVVGRGVVGRHDVGVVDASDTGIEGEVASFREVAFSGRCRVGSSSRILLS